MCEIPYGYFIKFISFKLLITIDSIIYNFNSGVYKRFLELIEQFNLLLKRGPERNK